MSFVRCEQCDWSQDDFWDEHYNPLKSLLDWQEALLTKDLDDPTCEIDGKRATVRNAIAHDCERAAASIREMRFRTKADAIAAGWRCPWCGGLLIED